MLDSLKSVTQTHQPQFDFSIVIPTWNNLAYLQLCVEGIRQNSALKKQIVVLLNEGKEGTEEWLSQQSDIDYVMAPTNIGICYGLNACRRLIKSNYFVYMNDDMYPLPQWDRHLMERIQSLDTKMFMLSATMIEPHDTGNPCVIVKDYGQDLESLKKEQLLSDFEGFEKADWSGSSWPPNVVHIDLWDLVGGYSTEFSPGMYSDPDFCRKLYNAGVRIFQGIGKSRVYHFGSRSTKRLKKSTGKRQFVNKWGMTANFFSTKFLQLGQSSHNILPDYTPSALENLVNRLKRLKAGW
jgi:glycosyltransferase involved in cell wall biosynthesis